MSPIDALERALEAATGQRVIERVQRGELTPTLRDLPIRHHETGQIVAWVPAKLADGMMPVVHNGLVVGYYRDTEKETLCPGFFIGGVALALVRCDLGARWMHTFNTVGDYSLGVRLT